MTWKHINDWPMYTISDTGLIRGRKNNRILSLRINANGYARVVLCNEGTRKNMLVHRLVAMNFIPNENNYPVINHKDCDKLNNSVNNLEWCTIKHNNQHAYANGLKVMEKGERHGMAKLSDGDVKLIRTIYAGGGVTYIDLAKSWGISKSMIGYIITKQNWTHV